MQTGDRLPTGSQAQKQERWGGTETNSITQTVELESKITGRLRKPGHVTVQGIKEHGGDDQPAAQSEKGVALRSGDGTTDLARASNRRQAANRIAQGQQGRNDRDLLHRTFTPGARRKALNTIAIL